jgi:hypothetical protein
MKYIVLLVFWEGIQIAFCNVKSQKIFASGGWGARPPGPRLRPRPLRGLAFRRVRNTRGYVFFFWDVANFFPSVGRRKFFPLSQPLNPDPAHLWPLFCALPPTPLKIPLWWQRRGCDEASA